MQRRRLRSRLQIRVTEMEVKVQSGERLKPELGRGRDRYVSDAC